MKNALSISSRESEIPHEHFIPIEHFEEPCVQNPEEDDKGLQSHLVMTILCTLWMIHREPLKRHISLLMLTFGKRQ